MTTRPTSALAFATWLAMSLNIAHGQGQSDGPLHDALRAVPAEAPIRHIDQAPPAPIHERPGTARTDADARWIAGYWDWDGDRHDFVWVTGGWRVAPPGRIWIDGFWKRDDQGWYRVAGFWSDREADRLVYRDDGPPKDHPDELAGPAPDKGLFYVPGIAVPDGASTKWRAGFWTEARAGWTWMPARWIRQPEGWTFQDGYWDDDPARREVLGRRLAPEREIVAGKPQESGAKPVVPALGNFATDLIPTIGTNYGSVVIGSGTVGATDPDVLGAPYQGGYLGVGPGVGYAGLGGYPLPAFGISPFTAYGFGYPYGLSNFGFGTMGGFGLYNGIGWGWPGGIGWGGFGFGGWGFGGFGGWGPGRGFGPGWRNGGWGGGWGGGPGLAGGYFSGAGVRGVYGGGTGPGMGRGGFGGGMGGPMGGGGRGGGGHR